MKYDEFVGHVQNRARLGTQSNAVRAIRATLETLSERIVAGEAEDIAAQLPQEIGQYLKHADTIERFSLDGFFDRVAERENIDLPEAAYHARVVISVVKEAISPGELSQLKDQLPDEFQPLFDGHEGKMAT